jgi:hypothetical protein
VARMHRPGGESTIPTIALFIQSPLRHRPAIIPSFG